MSEPTDADSLLVRRIRRADADAWQELIDKYHGRLLAFAESRVGRQQSGEDIVQDTFIGFLTSLPNFDHRRSLESYLFSICAHKLTDHMRREGSRPFIGSVHSNSNSAGEWKIPDAGRGASSIARGSEVRRIEEDALVSVLQAEIARWRARADWDRIRCAELLFVRGWSNKDTAATLSLTEQQIANYKFEFLDRIKGLVRKQCREAFPELFNAE